MKKRIFLLFLFNLALGAIYAQFSIYNISNVSDPAHANLLVDKLVGTGVTYSNPTFTGSTAGTQSGNAGYFSGGSSVVGINSGIIISTGNVGNTNYGPYEYISPNNELTNLQFSNELVTSPNTVSYLSTITGTGSDATLNSLIGETTYDKAVLEFDFVPESNFIQFRYVFASEEYNEYVNSQYNDVFGFFVTSLESDGYNYNNKNIAIVPGTPNTAVAINTINNGPCSGAPNCADAGVGPCTNCSYFIDNTSGVRAIEYDGFTTVLTASCAVTPCKSYHMKIAIADVYDHIFDSAVLLEENSFTSPIVDQISYTTSNPVAGGGTNMVEGCSNGTLTFLLSSATPMDRNVPFTLGGSAQFGVDYNTIPDISGSYTPPNNYYVTIPAGQQTTTLTIVPVQDGSIEATESIDFGIQTNLCGTPIINSGTVYILDNSTPFSSSLPPTVDICNGSSTTLNATINGGQTPFTYSWNSGHTTNPINVNPGSTTTYSVTITDACGLTSTASSTVNVNPVPSAIPSVTTQSICSGTATNITIGSNVSGADYVWTATPSGNITGYANGTGNLIQQTLINNDATAGTVTYSIQATANGCTGNPVNVVVTVNPSPTIDSVDVVNNSVCIGTPDGQITINASGGTAPLSYSLDGGSLQANNVFTQIGTGQHNALVQDANGCQATYNNILVNGTSGPVINQVQTTDLTCYGINTGVITIDATGAAQYSIDNGSNWQASNTFTNLPAGTYAILVQDAGQCNTPSLAVIQSPSQITASFVNNDEFCGTPGSSHITVSGGTPGYTYLWSTGSTLDSIFNITGGSYSVTVTDANNCTNIFNTVVGSVPAPIINSINSTNVSCFNGTNGSITIQATGAQFYSIDNGNTWSSNSTFNNLPVDTYQVVVRDANGCTDHDVVTLTSPSAMSAEITADPEVCGAPGGASVTITGGTAPYIYLWSTGDTTSSIHGIYHGTYTVTVSDANGCTSQFNATVAYQGGNIQLSYTSTNVACHGDSTGSIQLSVLNITPPYMVNWSHTSDTSLVQSNLPAGAYNVTVSDAYGCTSVATIPIAEPAALNIDLNITNPSCYNSNDGQITANVNGGVSPYSYSWSIGGSGSTISPLVAGVYHLTVTDANQCSVVETNIQLSNPPQLVVLTQAQNPLCFNGNEGMIVASANGGTPPYQYQWIGGINNDTLLNVSNGTYEVTVVDAHYCTATSSATLYNPPAMTVNGQTQVINHIGSIDITVQGGLLPYSYLWSNGATSEDLTNLGGGTFIVTITDANHCLAVDTFTIDIPLEIPTVITPNNDGKNDDFEIIGVQGYEKVSVEIYGRWGDKLFDFKGTGLEYVNKSNRWNGKYNGKDLPMGSYIYIIRLNDDDPITGVVAIIR